MASLGFLFVAGSDIPPSSLTFAIDMLRKLTTEPDVYDCACLLVVEGAQGFEEDDERDDRAVEQEPTALLSLREVAGDDEDLVGPQAGSAEPGRRIGALSVRRDVVPDDLGADHYFEVLISRALDRMPVAVYPGVRERRAAALG